MNKLIVLSGLLTLMILPMISADIISPGYRPINIENKITNINDFPDYVFVSIGSLGEIGGPMCPIERVSNEGFIMPYYKFCSVSVYAIKKSDLNENLLFNYTRPSNYNETLAKERSAELENYFSSKGIKVISHVSDYKEVPLSSTQSSIVNYYTIELSKTIDKPSNIEIKRSNMIYVYIIIPIIVLLIILFIFYKRKK